MKKLYIAMLMMMLTHMRTTNAAALENWELDRITQEMLNGELAIAAQAGDLGKVIELIEFGANPIVPRTEGGAIAGTTPLMKAVHGGHVDIATYLLGLGAQPNEIDRSGLGITPFQLAVREGNFPMVKLLAENGGDPEAQNKSGNSAYDIAGREYIGRGKHVYKEIQDYLYALASK